MKSCTGGLQAKSCSPAIPQLELSQSSVSEVTFTAFQLHTSGLGSLVTEASRHDSDHKDGADLLNKVMQFRQHHF